MKKFLAFLLCAATLAGFACCSDDDEDGNDSNSLIVGTWVCDFSTGYYGYTFRADGTGTSFESDYSDHISMNSITYVYNSGKKTLLINEDGDKEEYKVRKLTAEELVLEDSYGDSETYYREE